MSIIDSMDFDPVHQNGNPGYDFRMPDPAAYAVKGGYPDDAAFGQGNNPGNMDMAGGMGRQWPASEPRQAMNQSMGFTNRRYGATAPDAQGVEAIASKNIDRMDLMEPENHPMAAASRPMPPERRNGLFKRPSDSLNRNEQEMRNPSNMMAGKPPTLPGVYQGSMGQQTAEKPDSKSERNIVEQFAASMGKKRFNKLVDDLSKLTAKLPLEIAKSKRSPDPMDYLRHASRFFSKKG